MLALRFSKFFGALGKRSCASFVGHAKKQLAVWESAHVCIGCLVHNSSDHGRDHNHWSHGGRRAPVARGKKKSRNVDPALRTWLSGPVTRKRSRNTEWAPRGLAVDLAPNTVHDNNEEGMSFYFWTISQYGSTALHWNVAFGMSCLGCEQQKMVERTWTKSVVDSCGFSSETNCERMAFVSYQPEECSALNTREQSHQLKNAT